MELGKHYIAVLADDSQIRFRFVGGASADLQFEDGTLIPLSSLPRYKEIVEDPDKQEA